MLDSDQSAPINQMHRFSMGDAMVRNYETVHRGPLMGLDDRAILGLRGNVLQAIARNGADINLVKTHNANGKEMGVTLIPPALTKLAVCILRNPLDMVISYARHYALTVDQTIQAIARPANGTVRDKGTVAQYLNTWSRHVDSWTRAKTFPVHVMRYEDMLAEPAKTFGALIKRIGLPEDNKRLEKAIEFASFKELRRQEDAYGFIEQSAHSGTFFHSGQAEQWKDTLTAAQVDQIRKDHGKVMQRFGYL